MPLPNPWVVIGVVLSMAACFVAGHVQGHKAERKTWELALARQQTEAAQLLAQSETARRNAARAFNTFKDKVEVEHAAQETRIDAAHAAYRRLLAERGGLPRRQGTCRWGVWCRQAARIFRRRRRRSNSRRRMPTFKRDF
jgi:hypothetical protein